LLNCRWVKDSITCTGIQEENIHLIRMRAKRFSVKSPTRRWIFYSRNAIKNIFQVCFYFSFYSNRCS
jgi:hypothetical protein